ncbi:MAG: N-acetyl-alpha-D-glucosaminyl L-malate synthase [candidate division WS2 bacterium]|uniref:N-acetyl-alpha-D-glucosaminyl L-malate synthase n=1 Tax=Psychracetigena formicireducens TaxID=2986056 RepID=A0A9E2BNB9_PSYF1|nr:N-acetyl-alpha-D-glucosaminyl L-malate synthase [Candidatus Psychracetigena formicireducens]
MRILFVSPGILYSEQRRFEDAGSESVIYGLSKEMVKRGHEVYIVGRFGNFGGAEYKVIEDIQFINIKIPNLHDEIAYEIGSALAYSRKAVSRILEISPDVISLNERFSAYFPSKLNIPKTFTTHVPEAMGFFKQFAVKSHVLNHLLVPFKKVIEERVMRRSDIIIALNRTIEDYLHTRGFTNTCPIPNAIDVKKYENKGEDNFVLYAGGFRKVKGVNFLIEAFAKIGDKYDTNLQLIGSGPEEEKLKKLVRAKKLEHRVHFMPLVRKTELRERYLAKCSVFVLPSLFECMPVTLLEAMASGKPVIAGDIPGPTDIITQGYDGFLFEKGNIDELKEYLELHLSDGKLRKIIGKNARKTVEEKYTFEKVADHYLKLYEEVLLSKSNQ